MQVAEMVLRWPHLAIDWEYLQTLGLSALLISIIGRTVDQMYILNWCFIYPVFFQGLGIGTCC